MSIERILVSCDGSLDLRFTCGNQHQTLNADDIEKLETFLREVREPVRETDYQWLPTGVLTESVTQLHRTWVFRFGDATRVKVEINHAFFLRVGTRSGDGKVVDSSNTALVPLGTLLSDTLPRGVSVSPLDEVYLRPVPLEEVTCLSDLQITVLLVDDTWTASCGGETETLPWSGDEISDTVEVVERLRERFNGLIGVEVLT